MISNASDSKEPRVSMSKFIDQFEEQDAEEADEPERSSKQTYH